VESEDLEPEEAEQDGDAEADDVVATDDE